MESTELGDISALKKSELVDDSGRSFRSQRETWKPRFGVVWVDILVGYVALVTIALLSWQPLAGPVLFLQVSGCAVAFGYVHAYLQLFMHEAAHYNLCPGRRLNDRMANVFLGAWVGLGIVAYRPIHFDHHRYLGTTRDSERSYFNALDSRLIFESITGLHVLRVLLGRRRDAGQKSQARRQAPLVQGFVMHAAVLLVAYHAGRYGLMVAWVLGIGTMFPFFATIRQLMEHRSLYASRDTDYSVVDHGEVNRMFGTGPLATTLGGAGFNRHLLHHWDPQLSYTRLPDMERFLMETSMALTLKAARTTYLKTFLGLMRAP